MIMSCLHGLVQQTCEHCFLNLNLHCITDLRLIPSLRTFVSVFNRLMLFDSNIVLALLFKFLDNSNFILVNGLKNSHLII